MRRVRDGVFLGAASVLLASLAVAMLLRKPAPHIFTPIFTPVAGPAAAAETIADPVDGLQLISPPEPIPDLKFEDADGNTHTLHEFLGKPVLLNIWATWCGPCVEELPSLAALAPRAAKDGIVVLPLSVDRGGTGRVRSFYASHGIDALPAWNDSEGTATEALGLHGVPTTFLIDADGRTVAKLEGAADWNAGPVLGKLRELVRSKAEAASASP